MYCCCIRTWYKLKVFPLYYLSKDSYASLSASNIAERMYSISDSMNIKYGYIVQSLMPRLFWAGIDYLWFKEHNFYFLLMYGLMIYLLNFLTIFCSLTSIRSLLLICFKLKWAIHGLWTWGCIAHYHGFSYFQIML